MYRLVIGNRNYSSWSLRAWLHLAASGIPFETVRLTLYSGGEWKQALLNHAPSGRVPVLIDGDTTVWDSLAIMEYISEQNAAAIGWPQSSAARAHARSICAEMHSGFLALRDELPQNIRARSPLQRSELSQACGQQLARIEEIWSDCRRRYGGGGEWLFGDMSIADIMYAPVALRLVTYALDVDGPARSFVDAVRQHPAVQQWCTDAAAEKETIDFIDQRIPAEQSPLVLG